MTPELTYAISRLGMDSPIDRDSMLTLLERIAQDAALQMDAADRPVALAHHIREQWFTISVATCHAFKTVQMATALQEARSERHR